MADQFVVESRILCIHGEQYRLNLSKERLPDELEKNFLQVSADFLQWYLFEYLQPKNVLAVCGPDVFRVLAKQTSTVTNPCNIVLSYNYIKSQSL